MEKLKYALEKVLDGEAVLFAGAGFSNGAENEKGTVPSAIALKNELCTEIGIDSNTYNLETISQYYINKKSPEELISKLKQIFNIRNVADHHRIITNLPWKRIYTTNYDQVIERASESLGNDNRIEPIILSDKYIDNKKDHICIHINGYIEHLNTRNINNEFKLTDVSYSCDLIQDNPWFELLINDFESASSIIIIGYSMQYDIDIKRLLSAPQISKKVIFIDSPNIDEVSLNLIKCYGQCYPIGIQEFGNEVEKARNEYIPKFNHKYKCFSHIYKGNLKISQPRYEEIVKFYTEGKKSNNLFEKNRIGDYKYLLFRNAIDIFLRKYKSQKMFIALSGLGNGKSVFLDMVVNELRTDEIDIYVYRHRYDTIDDEIERICHKKKKSIVVIDNYTGHMDILDKFNMFGHKYITFLLSARNSLNQVFYKQLQRRVGIDYRHIFPIYLDRIKDTEVDDIANILDSNKLLTEAALNINGGIAGLKTFIKNDCKSSFSELLLKMFDSPDIKGRLNKLYSSVDKCGDEKLKEVVIFSLLKNISNYDISFLEILDLFKANYFSLQTANSEFMREIFELNEGGTIAVRSSIISMSLIQNVIKTEDVIKTMKEAFLSADKKQGKVYNELQKGLISHSQFVYLTNTSRDLDKLEQIESFYEDIRNTKFARHNPFFWEQFASAYIDMKNFDLAKKCLETSLFEAKNIPGFVPFQVRTIQGRYYVEKCFSELTNGKSSPSDAIKDITDSCNSILMHYNHPENNLYYVFKVVKYYPMIFNLIKDRIDKRELLIYIEKCSIMTKKMEDYFNNSYGDYNVFIVKRWREDIIDSINEAKELLRSIK